MNRFEVNGIFADFNFLGSFPKEFEKLNKNKLIDKFIETFQYTFTNTVFSYYGNLSDIKEIIEDSVILEEIGWEKFSKRKQWETLILLVEKMFFDMHSATMGMETIDYIFDRIDDITEDELNIFIHDLNLSIYFAIEECLIITPSMLREFGATSDDVFMLDEFLSKQQVFEDVLKKYKFNNKIVKEKYEEIFKVSFNIKDYKKTFYNGFLLHWIDNIEEPDCLKNKELTQDDVDECCAEIFALIITFTSLFLENEDDILELTDHMYKFVIDIFEEKYLKNTKKEEV